MLFFPLLSIMYLYLGLGLRSTFVLTLATFFFLSVASGVLGPVRFLQIASRSVSHLLSFILV